MRLNVTRLHSLKGANNLTIVHHHVAHLSALCLQEALCFQSNHRVTKSIDRIHTLLWGNKIITNRATKRANSLPLIEVGKLCCFNGTSDVSTNWITTIKNDLEKTRLLATDLLHSKLFPPLDRITLMENWEILSMPGNTLDLVDPWTGALQNPSQDVFLLKRCPQASSR